jgi:hypothetical protein
LAPPQTEEMSCLRQAYRFLYLKVSFFIQLNLNSATYKGINSCCAA